MKKFLLLVVLAAPLYAQLPSPYARESARPSEPWVTNGIIYEIYPRSFSAAGNFAGIEKRLPELKQLGVTTLWLMPIHPVGKEKRKGTLGSPYSIQDYYGINPEFGTLEDFQRLVRSTHAQGMKIVIDLVANHTSWDSRMFREHPEWFTKDSSGNFVPPVADWSDVVDLNYDSKEMRRYMIEMMKYWVRDIGLDGFRCDVAEMVPTDFWNDARAALDSIKPVLMLAEGQYPEHHLKAFDVTYAWNFYGIIGPVVNGEKTVAEFDTVLSREAAAYPKGSLRLRFSSNHDENAWDKPDVEKFGAEGAKLAAVLTNTFPGVPLLYNGQEAGNDIKLGLFEKFDIDWSKGKAYRQFYTKLYSIRKNHSALSTGEFIRVRNDRPERVYSFLRADGKSTLLTVLNFADEAQHVRIELPETMRSKKYIDAFTGKKAAVAKDGSLHLPRHGYALWIAQ